MNNVMLNFLEACSREFKMFLSERHLKKIFIFFEVVYYARLELPVNEKGRMTFDEVKEIIREHLKKGQVEKIMDLFYKISSSRTEQEKSYLLRAELVNYINWFNNM